MLLSEWGRLRGHYGAGAAGIAMAALLVMVVMVVVVVVVPYVHRRSAAGGGPATGART